jgi:hypothetical protein
MKNTIIDVISFFIDKFLILIFIPLAPFLKVFLRLGPRRMKLSTFYFKRIGVFPISDHYYQPLFNDTHLKKPLNNERDLPGIEFNLNQQKSSIDTFNFSKELEELDLYKPSDLNNNFNINNGGYGPGDADFLYNFVRNFKPNKIIEIGSGNSTKIVNLAINKNKGESSQGKLTQHICIEPYEMPWLDNFDVTLLRSKVEDTDIEIFRSLEEGDLLFIDSSHIIRPQGDVLHEYQRILPILKKGVYIHVHDIFSPRDYLEDWIKKDVKMWNEQYLLESLLTYSNKFKIKYSLNFMKHSHYKSLKNCCPYLKQDSEPGSIYIEVI